MTDLTYIALAIFVFAFGAMFGYGLRVVLEKGENKKEEVQ